MGALTLPASGLVYLDTMILIYTVERYPAYWSLLEPLWLAAQTKTIEIVSSELTLMAYRSLVFQGGSGNPHTTFSYKSGGRSQSSRRRFCTSVKGDKSA